MNSDTGQKKNHSQKHKNQESRNRESKNTVPKKKAIRNVHKHGKGKGTQK